MVWQRTVNPSLFGANRFDPYHLHQFLARSYRGYYVGLSIRSREFESPTSRQFVAGRVWSPAWSHKPLPSLVRIQVPLPVLGFIQQLKNFTVNEKKANPVVLAQVVEWYTRWSQKPLPKGLRVRVSPCAPDKQIRYSTKIKLPRPSGRQKTSYLGGGVISLDDFLICCFGDIAQLVVRLLHTERVSGSNPLITTKFRSVRV